MSDKKKTTLKYTIPIGAAVYLFIIFYAMHVNAVMRLDRRMGLAEGLSEGFTDMYTNPFAIFPITYSLVRWIGIGTLMAGLVLFIIWVTADLRNSYAQDKLHGDAKFFENYAEYNKKFTEPLGKPHHKSEKNVILSKNVWMSMDMQKINRNLNEFIVGGSGAGKSYNFAGPNIMQANSSLIITDPSGGLFKKYGSFLEGRGYRVKCFNLDHMEKGCHYNPFHYIRNDKDIEILVTTLISNTTPPEQSGGDPFWEKSETALLVALIAYLFHHCEEGGQSFSNVMRLMRMARVDENNPNAESELDHLFNAIIDEDPEDFAGKQYQTFKMGAGKTLKGILISCAVRLQAFDLEDVANLTNTDTLDLDDVGDEKTALFVIIPTGEKTFNFLASMMYSQLFQRLYEYCENTAEFSQLVIDSNGEVVRTFRAANTDDVARARKEAEEFLERAKHAKIIENEKYRKNKLIKKSSFYEIRTKKNELVAFRGTKEAAEAALSAIKGGHILGNDEQSNDGQRLPIHVRMILDEFPNTGRIPEFSEKVATIRKYEISTAIIVQSLKQMQNLYKDDWETITGNCDVTIYLGGGADTITTEWIAKLMGKETRKGKNETYNSNGGGSVSYNTVGEDLMSPAQLRTMPERKCIVLMKSLDPFFDDKYPSHNHPNMKVVKSLPAYYFNPEKDEYLARMSQGHAVRKANKVEKPTESMTKKTDEDIRARNQINAQKNEEYKKNKGADGRPVVGEPENIQAESSSLKQQMKLNTMKDVDESVESSVQFEDSLGPDEMYFGSAI